jgi:hypothetical protein
MAFPFACPNLVEIDDELCTPILDMGLDVFNACFKKSSWYFQSLVFLGGFLFENFRLHAGTKMNRFILL